MKLGPKSRLLLDVLVTSGADALLAFAFPRQTLLAAGGWSCDRALSRRLEALSEKGLIEWDGDQGQVDWVIKVTSTGKQALHGHFDPRASWETAWDGQWRMVAFDLPADQHRSRKELLRWLKDKRFGCLQGSLWITPRRHEAWYEELSSFSFAPSSVSLFDGRTMARTNPRDVVSHAWNFERINKLYAQLIRFHLNLEGANDGPEPSREWRLQERELWSKASSLDPFLPEPLLPSGYLGKKAWKTRQETFSRLLKPEANP